tara:strand:+ start:903 stop:1226 length:324 start_codon:yes stop_codon:yes gene_type:complete
MTNTQNLVNALGDINVFRTLIQNRKSVTQPMLDLLYMQGIEGVIIDKHDMGESTWYNFYRKENVKPLPILDWDRVYLGSQFFWNEGKYDANGVHSLFDEYGNGLLKA